MQFVFSVSLFGFNEQYLHCYGLKFSQSCDLLRIFWRHKSLRHIPANCQNTLRVTGKFALCWSLFRALGNQRTTQTSWEDCVFTTSPLCYTRYWHHDIVWSYCNLFIQNNSTLRFVHEREYRNVTIDVTERYRRYMFIVTIGIGGSV